MIAVDTNILVYAFRPEAAEHAAARAAVRRLLTAGSSWAIPWTVVYEFLSVVTQPRIWRQPASPREALGAIEAWSDAGGAILLAEAAGHREVLSGLLDAAAIRGSRVFDARVAATCIDHGVHELWSVDRDFGRFPSLKVVNPLL